MPSFDFAPISAPGVLKADCTQGPLMSLGGSSSEQASTSKQQFSLEQPLYGAAGSRDDIFSLGGPSYMTTIKNCGSRTLGCVSETTTDNSFIVSAFLSCLSQRLPFLPTAGQPCWTVKWRAQETPISPCWRDRLRSHSQMKVGSHSVCHPQEYNVCLACAAMTTTRKKQPFSLA